MNVITNFSAYHNDITLELHEVQNLERYYPMYVYCVNVNIYFLFDCRKRDEILYEKIPIVSRARVWYHLKNVLFMKTVCNDG